MIKNPKAFCCWSGGKESLLSLYRAKKSGIHISYLVNMISENGKYSRSHGLSSELLKLQAKALGISIVQRKTTWKTYEEEFKKAVSDFRREGIQAGVFGDIDLQEHKDWVERVSKDVGIVPLLPLWKERRERLLKEFIDLGFKAIIVATQAEFLGKEWLGREINNEFIKELKALGNIDLCGEKGEFHTFVTSGPLFKKRIEITKSRKRYKKGRWFLDILEWKIV